MEPLESPKLEESPLGSPSIPIARLRPASSSDTESDPTKRHTAFFSAGGSSIDGEEEEEEEEEEVLDDNEFVDESLEETKASEEEKEKEEEEEDTLNLTTTTTTTIEEPQVIDPTPTQSNISLPPTLSIRPLEIVIPTVKEVSSNSTVESESESTPLASSSKIVVEAAESVKEDATSTISSAAAVYGCCLVAFDHAQGPIIEWSYPESLLEDTELVARLPFLALPDGAHTREEDYSYFHLLLPSIAESTVFGISCNRQIPSAQLLNKGKEVTRSTVQKAIVVLASKPIFGPLRDKLGVITRAFFAQKDFDDKSILMDLYSSLEAPLASGSVDSGEGEDQGLYMGTSLRELVHTFRNKTLMLLKLLLLQRRVMFYAASSPVESLCTFQYSLVALIPALLAHLEDSASPELNAKAQPTEPPASLRTSDKQSLLRYLGLPLHIFGEGAFFQPYLPLQQIDFLQKTNSFLVGTTNSIFQQQRDCPIDVIVNLELAALEIADPKLASLLVLTAADRKWMDEMVSTVDSTWNAVDPSRPVGLSFIGSDDFIRAKFEEYICSMLACIKFTDFLANAEKGNTIITGNDADSNMLTAFNEKFVEAFKATPAFELWDQSTDSVIFDLVEPKHPMEGKTNPIEDVGIRLAHGLHDLHIEENLAPTREAITRGITSGSDTLWNAYSSIKSDFAKRQSDRSEKLKLAQASSPSGTTSPLPVPIAPILPVDYTTPILAGVDVAKTQAASIATGLGSFFSSKRTQYFSPVSSPTSTIKPQLPKNSRTTSSNSFEHSLPSLYPDSSSSSSADPLSPPSPTSPGPTISSFGSFFRPPSIASLPSLTSATSPSSGNSGTGIGLGTPPYWGGPTSPTSAISPTNSFFSSFTRRVSETLAVVETNVRHYANEGVGTTTVVDEKEEDERYKEEAVELAKVRDLDKEYEDRKRRQAELLELKKEGGNQEEEEEGIEVEEPEVEEDFEEVELEKEGENGLKMTMEGAGGGSIKEGEEEEEEK